MIQRLLLFAVAYETPLISNPLLITLIIPSCLSSIGRTPSFVSFKLLSLVARPRSMRRSFKFPCFNSSVTFSRRAWHSFVRWPWSWWNSHHFLVSQTSDGAFIFCSHFTVSPIPFSTSTSSVGSMFRLYSGNFGFSCIGLSFLYGFLESLNSHLFSIRQFPVE